MLPHGVLFRGAAEGHIRRYLIAQKNCLDAVIGLPANVFYGTSIPTCILLLKKDRKKNRNNILFIDASNHFAKATNQNYLREEDLKRILDAVKKRETTDKFSYVASINEIAEENDYNLNIPRYVDTFEEEEDINFKVLINELKELELNMLNVDYKIKEYCLELGIQPPFEVSK